MKEDRRFTPHFSPLTFHLSCSRGFTLIELILVIVLLGILAALTANLLANSLDQSRFDDTFKEMNDLSKAMVGNPDLVNAGVRSDFGFVGDMGGLPTSLTQLLTQGTLPAWTVYDTDLGTGTGWRGPYLETKQDDSGTYLATLDGWGNPYAYNAATGQVTSYGSDGAPGGSGFAADLTVPETSQTTTGSVNGRVLDQVGNPVRSTTVTIRHPDPASPGNPTDTTAITDSNGNFSFTGIPIGKHRIQVTVGTETIKRVVVVLPGQTVNVSLQASNDPTIPCPPTAVTATPISLSQINLSWTPPTTNEDAGPTCPGTLSLMDLKGYHIYRGTAAGPTALYATVGLGSSFSDTNVVAGQRYFYRLKAVDLAGNISTTYSNEVTAPATLIIQNGGETPAIPMTSCVLPGAFSVTSNIQNTTANPVTITEMTVTWVNRAGCPTGRTLRTIILGGTTVWTGTNASGQVATLTTPFTLAAGAIVPMEVRFSGNTGFDSMSVRFNNFGYLAF